MPTVIDEAKFLFLVHNAAAHGKLDAVKLFVEFKVDVDLKKEEE